MRSIVRPPSLVAGQRSWQTGAERELSRSEFYSAFVLMQYFGYPRRDPDTTGFNFWLTKLNQFDGNYQSADMVKAFLASQEYRTRFGL